MKKLSHRSTIYLVENVLVLVMIGSAIVLQVMKARKGKDEGESPLVEIAEEVSKDLVPWPFNLLASVITEVTENAKAEKAETAE